jgi:O-antigen ligase
VPWENPGIYFKAVSFGVHNGPLQVALLFGILGLLAWIYTLGYFCKHFIHSLSKVDERAPLDLGVGMSTWFISSSLVSTLFSPWNMSSSQTCLLVGFIFAFMQARLKVISHLSG